MRVAILTVSDRSARGQRPDLSGPALVEAAEKCGWTVVSLQVVADERRLIETGLRRLVAGGDVDVVLTTGGTGISPRDVTIEALQPHFTKELFGFGSLFARLSYDEVKAAAIISRATAGVVGRAIVFCLPGSLKACQLACNALIFPELGHLVGHAFRE